jgi:hypothetical protein
MEIPIPPQRLEARANEIFDSDLDRSYGEIDPRSPINAYGASQLAASGRSLLALRIADHRAEGAPSLNSGLSHDFPPATWLETNERPGFRRALFHIQHKESQSSNVV